MSVKATKKEMIAVLNKKVPYRCEVKFVDGKMIKIIGWDKASLKIIRAWYTAFKEKKKNESK